MNTKEVQRFLTLRSKIYAELEEIHSRLEELDAEAQKLTARHDLLQKVLDGSLNEIEEPEEEELPEPHPGPVDIDDAIYEFLQENPQSARFEIIEAMARFGQDVPYQVDKALKRLKRREQIKRTGNTRNSTWSAV